MTIKQQGGIFGRNPTFNNVEVDGTLTANSVSTSQFDTSIDVNGSVTSNGFIVDTASTANLATYTYTSVDRSKIEGQQVGGAGGKLDFKTNDGGGLKSRVNIDHVGDVVFYKTDGTTAGMTYDASAFSLAFASGGGIDFSATSGTGTSELFDDYEEGTWTPSVIGATSGSMSFGSVAIARYTKVGRIVSINLYMTGGDFAAHTVSGNVLIQGLPYAASSVGAGVISVAYCNLTTADEADITLSGYVEATSLRLLKGSSTSAVTGADLASSGTNGAIMLSIVYETGA
jgi:hypothetical protein